MQRAYRKHPGVLSWVWSWGCAVVPYPTATRCRDGACGLHEYDDIGPPKSQVSKKSRVHYIEGDQSQSISDYYSIGMTNHGRIFFHTREQSPPFSDMTASCALGGVGTEPAACRPRGRVISKTAGEQQSSTDVHPLALFLWAFRRADLDRIMPCYALGDAGLERRLLTAVPSVNLSAACWLAQRSAGQLFVPVVPCREPGKFCGRIPWIAFPRGVCVCQKVGCVPVSDHPGTHGR